MLLCKRRYLRDLGFCDVFGIHAAYGGSLIMYLEHDLCCPFLIHQKKHLQNLDDEFHGGEIIIQQYHLVELGRLGFAALQQGHVFLFGCHRVSFFHRALTHI